MEITKPKIIAVEGQDEINFFNALLNNLHITDVQVIEFEGKTNFQSRIKAIVNVPGFRNVRYFALVRDADNLPEKSAFESVKHSLSAAKLPYPAEIKVFTNTTPAVGIFIMPGNENTGMLEDLCLSSIKEYPVYQCIETFFECSDEKPHEKSKAEIQCYLSTKNPLANSLGVGAKKGHWDFNSPVFDEIKGFLENIR
jgi:hypothetical protein